VLSIAHKTARSVKNIRGAHFAFKSRKMCALTYGRFMQKKNGADRVSKISRREPAAKKYEFSSTLCMYIRAQAEEQQQQSDKSPHISRRNLGNARLSYGFFN
jgi:hypothetical protein